MATLVKRGSAFRIQVVIDGNRESLGLGRMTERNAQAFQRHVELLEIERRGGRPVGKETAGWLETLIPKHRAKLVELKLIEPEKAPVGLAPFLDHYLSTRRTGKQRTADRLRYAADTLVEYFGSDRPFASITADDAAEFEHHLLTKQPLKRGKGKGWKPNTVRKTIQRAKHFAAVAIKCGIMTVDPFEDLSGNVQPARDRDHFVTKEDFERLLHACPDDEWRTIIALGRIGGLRIPSELSTLKWSDVDFVRQRLRIRNVKTEHNATVRPYRELPLFPRLESILRKWKARAGGSELVIERCRDAKVNLRQYLLRIIRKAGLKPWPKLMQNLRASRATELIEEGFASHVAAAFIGHSEKIADAHYRMTLKSHYDRAIANDTFPALRLTVHKTVQSFSETTTRFELSVPAEVFDLLKTTGNSNDLNWIINHQYPRQDSNL